jgi:hypothetical protein
MEDRNNPGFMLGEPSGMDEVWMALYNEDPEFREDVLRQSKAKVLVYDAGSGGVSAGGLAYLLGCSDLESQLVLDRLVELGVVGVVDGVYCHTGLKKEK